MMQAMEQLQARLAEVKAVRSAAALLEWDQQTYMPRGGAEARANQLGVLSKIGHEMATGAETERLLAGAEREVKTPTRTPDEAAFARVARRDFDQAAKLPTALVADTQPRHGPLAHEEWARPGRKAATPSSRPGWNRFST